ncbi:recQ-mediated genome instability protein 1 [Latimeria chalumnae]|uniref:recQ-mediated genome instability protein 1 n=1 Tax=Latimeria chalumnae TaxID=7897 RepID=UPI0003C1544D|nr:PREDICTED: recQ-mediated genome instability protein 1 [Latimeria chalumnae]|eukprot:XP_006008963.1 PREDICTED: recQ-mediated genome instability protein 1 [Latimeria chalumnae]
MSSAGIGQKVEAWLQSTWHVKVPVQWLEACIDWIQQENQGVTLNQSQINKQVFEQWLLTDLRDLECPVLPNDISGSLKIELKGFYCVQIDFLVDVSLPAYSQLQKLRGRENPNEQITATMQVAQKPWEAKPTRMLMLRLTDGIQQLQGMEYQPVPFLHASLPPGTKILLQGNIPCRLGVLLLKPENVKVLGGEVEALVEENAQERILARHIGEPDGASALQDNCNQQTPHNAEEELGQALGPSNEELIAALEEDDQFIINDETDLESGYGSRSNSSSNALSYLLPESTLPRNRSQSFENLVPHIDISSKRTRGPSVQFSDTNFDDFPIDDLDEMLLEQDLEEVYVEEAVANNTNHEAHLNRETESATCKAELCASSAWPLNSSSNHVPEKSINIKNTLSVAYQSKENEPMGKGMLVRNKNVTICDPCPQTEPQPQNTLRNSSESNVVFCGQKIDTNAVGCASGKNKVKLIAKCEPLNNRPLDIGRTVFKNEIISGASSNSSCIDWMPSREEDRKRGLSSTKTAMYTPHFIYLSVLLAKKSVLLEVIQVKAFIVTLTGNLTSDGGVWNIKAKISDGTAYLDVELVDEILISFIGFTVAETIAMKKDKSQRQKVIAGLQHCQKRLIDLCCLMTIEFNPTTSTGVVLALHDVGIETLWSLEERINK